MAPSPMPVHEDWKNLLNKKIDDRRSWKGFERQNLLADGHRFGERHRHACLGDRKRTGTIARHNALKKSNSHGQLFYAVKPRATGNTREHVFLFNFAL